MAWVFNVNQSVAAATIPQVMIDLKDALVASGGWTVESSGSGYSGTYNAAGDCWGSLAANLSRGAWIRIQHTASGMELLFQTYPWGWYPYYWAGWFSQSAPFTGGTPDKDTAPTATGSTTLFAAVNPTFTNATQRYHIITENVAPYRFFMGSGTSGAGALYTCCFMEALEAGTYPVANTFPYIISFGYSTSSNALYSSALYYAATPAQYTVVRQGEADQTTQRVYIPWLKVNGATAWPGTTGAPGDNPYDGIADTLRLPWMIPASQAGTAGWVGYSATFRGLLTSAANADTFNIDGGAKNWALWGRGVLLPWDGSDMLM